MPFVSLLISVSQGAQTTYHALLKPVLANISNKQVSSYSSPTTASADGLRDRVHNATTSE